MTCLMTEFYSTATVDKAIGYIFTESQSLISTTTCRSSAIFGTTMLFQAGSYSQYGRNPLMVHAELNEKTPLKPLHFARWLEIFRETIDRLFQVNGRNF